MEKIFIASDIHGSSYYAEKIISCFEQEGCDKLILLGDILYHGPRNPLPAAYDTIRTSQILNEYTDVILCVRGNCDAVVDECMLDFDITSPSLILDYNDRQFFFTHGDKYNKDNLPKSLKKGDVLVNGHFHIPEISLIHNDKIAYLNPGSASLAKGGFPNTYCVLDGDLITIKNLDTNEILFQTSIAEMFEAAAKKKEEEAAAAIVAADVAAEAGEGAKIAEGAETVEGVEIGESSSLAEAENTEAADLDSLLNEEEGDESAEGEEEGEENAEESGENAEGEEAEGTEEAEEGEEEGAEGDEESLTQAEIEADEEWARSFLERQKKEEEAAAEAWHNVSINENYVENEEQSIRDAIDIEARKREIRELQRAIYSNSANDDGFIWQARASFEAEEYNEAEDVDRYYDELYPDPEPSDVVSDEKISTNPNNNLYAAFFDDPSDALPKEQETHVYQTKEVEKWWEDFEVEPKDDGDDLL